MKNAQSLQFCATIGHKTAKYWCWQVVER